MTSSGTDSPDPIPLGVDKKPITRKTFYSDANKYWSSVEASVDGVLGGYGHLCTVDLKSSLQFLFPLVKGTKRITSSHRALDCGAGIGRVAKGLLVPLFDYVDLVDQCPKFIEEARQLLEPESEKIGYFYCCGLQDFVPKAGLYNVIWAQWVLGHLTDKDLVSFLKRCQDALVPSSSDGKHTGGLIIVKESTGPELDFDEKDSCFTRTRDCFLHVFAEAGLQIVKEKVQDKFPEELYEVRMFALQPARPTTKAS